MMFVIYTQSNITNIIYSPEYITTQKIHDDQIALIQSRSPSLRSSGRNARLWDNPFQGGI